MPIILKDHQTDHVAKIISHLRDRSSVFDMSDMGLGKTYTTIKAVSQMGFKKVMVICPAIADKKWREVASMEKFERVLVTSFSAMASRVGCQPKHGMLSRTGDQLTPTELFREWVEEGMCLVIDEVQNLKNNVLQTRACTELTDIVTRHLGRSRVILISGTPIDKQEQAVRMLRLLGLLRTTDLVHVIQLTGLQYLVDICNGIDRPETERILRKHRNTGYANSTYDLFVNIVVKHFSYSMPHPNVDLDIKNEVYKLSDDRRLMVNSHISNLNKCISGVVKQGEIAEILHKIEWCKMPIFEKLVRDTLRENPSAKVCVGFNYVEKTLYKLADNLETLKPMVITGATSRKERDMIIEKFQKDPQSRLLLANVKCVSTCVDLDDKVGDAPRFVFICPNYNWMDLNQFTRRFHRVDSVSKPVIRFVYADCEMSEAAVMKNLERKSGVHEEVVAFHK
jgi:SNF2 family DNA or RNA helicase